MTTISSESNSKKKDNLILYDIETHAKWSSELNLYKVSDYYIVKIYLNL
jgi:hypothetical protein